MQPFWHIDLGNTLTIAFVIVAWAYTAGTMGQRLKNVEDWREKAQQILEEVSASVTKLSAIEDYKDRISRHRDSFK